MDILCSENLSKININTTKINSLEKYSEDDKQTKKRIFDEIKETNDKVNNIDKEISILRNSFEGFKKSMNDNYNEFKEDMKDLFNSIFIKSMAAIIMMICVSKFIDKFWK